ncbi:hypothetical protein HK101_011738 [Irineochytrium annulatum]|nr:hypothetical protein HK101_011738 [Irineochytrium annulatum]
MNADAVGHAPPRQAGGVGTGVLDNHVLQLILEQLNPDFARDRRALVVCLTVNSTFFAPAARVLWSGAALAIHRGIFIRSVAGVELSSAVAQISPAIQIRGNKGKGDEAGASTGRRAWRWGLYLGAVRKLVLLPRGAVDWMGGCEFSDEGVESSDDDESVVEDEGSDEDGDPDTSVGGTSEGGDDEDGNGEDRNLGELDDPLEVDEGGAEVVGNDAGDDDQGGAGGVWNDAVNDGQGSAVTEGWSVGDRAPWLRDDGEGGAETEGWSVADLAPWLRKIDEVEIIMGDATDEWFGWLEGRWAAGNGPSSVGFYETSVDLMRAALSHKCVRRVSLDHDPYEDDLPVASNLLVGLMGLEHCLEELILGKLAPFNMDGGEPLLKHVAGKVQSVILYIYNSVTFPDGLPVKSMRMCWGPEQNMQIRSLAPTLQKLDVKVTNNAAMTSELFQSLESLSTCTHLKMSTTNCDLEHLFAALSNMPWLVSLNLEIKSTHPIKFPSFLHNMVDLRELSLKLRVEGPVKQEMRTQNLFRPLASLSSCVHLSVRLHNCDPKHLLSALPKMSWLKSLHLDFRGRNCVDFGSVLRPLVDLRELSIKFLGRKTLQSAEHEVPIDHMLHLESLTLKIAQMGGSVHFIVPLSPKFRHVVIENGTLAVDEDSVLATGLPELEVLRVTSLAPVKGRMTVDYANKLKAVLADRSVAPQLMTLKIKRREK